MNTCLKRSVTHRNMRITEKGYSHIVDEFHMYPQKSILIFIFIYIYVDKPKERSTILSNSSKQLVKLRPKQERKHSGKSTQSYPLTKVSPYACESEDKIRDIFGSFMVASGKGWELSLVSYALNVRPVGR